MTLELEGAIAFDVDEVNNYVSIGVETEPQAAAARARIAEFSLPDDAVVVRAIGPIDDLVLDGEDLREHKAQQQKSETAEATLGPTQVRRVDTSVNPVVGGVEIYMVPRDGYCTYGFTVRKDGVLGFITNSHCTKRIMAVDGDPVRQTGTGGPLIGYETRDFLGQVCGRTFCRKSDAALFRSSGAVPLKGRIAGTGPNPGDKDYTYTSTVNGMIFYPVAGAHYIAVTARTGFTRLVIRHTCVNLQTFASEMTVTCGSSAWPESGYPNIQQGDSGSPVITRNGSESNVVAEIFAGNPLDGTIWMNNSGGIWNEFGPFDYYIP